MRPMRPSNPRNKPRVCYYEPEEPALDEYTFCVECADFVYEYCAIHGPLLVVPDDKVPAVTNLPSYVPTAALTIPHVFLHIAPSYIPGAGLGVFSTLTLPAGVRFGPYVGQVTNEANSDYCWQIKGSSGGSHVVDAADAGASNWMRYVNCARNWHEQNLIAFQYRGQLYYRTIRIVPRHTELLVFYGTEFATRIGVDVRRYNAPLSYAQKMGAPPPKKKPKFTKDKNDVVPKNNEPLAGSQNLVAKRVTAITSSTTLTVKEAIIVNKHYSKHKKFTCDKCKLIFKSKEILTLHETNCISFENKKLEQPLMKSQIDQAFIVDNSYVCNKSVGNHTGSDVSNNNNKLTKNRDKKFICDKCKLIFKSKEILTLHETNCISFENKKLEQPLMKSQIDLVSTVDNSYAYNISKDTPTDSDVSNNSKGLTENRELEKLCYDKQQLLKTHTGEKPYACSYCNFKCSRKDTLSKHLRTHTGEKPYACTYCNFKCSQKGNLSIHLRTHTREKPYVCTYCNFNCSLKGNLSTHLRTHTGEKPYACSYCNFKCSRKGNLSTHLRTHTGEKPYACDICDFKCSQNSSLNTHLRTHTRKSLLFN